MKGVLSLDEVVDRRNTDSLKYDAVKSIWGKENLIPMWVADMDFRTPEYIIDAVREKCNTGILGYTICPESWYDAIIAWNNKRYGSSLKKEELIFMPGVVKGIIYSIQSLTKISDRIMIMPPVYHPFRLSILNNSRTVVNCPLKLESGKFNIDRELFESEIKGCKIFILCNPHNPGGRVWTKEELLYIDKVCKDNNVIVISDEIHADLTLPGNTTYMYSTISESARQNTIIFRAPSKAFNMPGLSSAYCIIHDENLRNRFKDYVVPNEFDAGNIFSYTPVVAAYNKGDEWLNEVNKYIAANVKYLDEYLKDNMPKIKAIVPQASYLVFLDCRALGLSQKELNNFFAEKANLALSDGEMFGKEGIGFMRLNIGCPLSILKDALLLLNKAYKKL